MANAAPKIDFTERSCRRPIWVSRNSPEWGIDIYNTAAVIIAIDFFSAGLIVHESPFDELQ
jgi:hypothetical protein